MRSFGFFIGGEDGMKNRYFKRVNTSPLYLIALFQITIATKHLPCSRLRLGIGRGAYFFISTRDLFIHSVYHILNC